MLRASDIFFAYRPGTPVLDGVSIDVERRTIVGLLGPNGSGKTTLLRIIARMLQPKSGRILLDGAPIETYTRRELARRIAVVPQETHATFDFSALDIVLMGRYPHLGTFELEGIDDLKIARDALGATGTANLEHRRFETLSGGEKQRVVIASALAQASELLLLDEPTASLDLSYQLEIAALLRTLNQERQTTMVICTHDLNLAASVCDQVVLLKGGRVLAHGATDVTINAANIQATYGVTADVHYHPQAGHLTVVPIERTR